MKKIIIKLELKTLLEALFLTLIGDYGGTEYRYYPNSPEMSTGTDFRNIDAVKKYY